MPLGYEEYNNEFQSNLLALLIRKPQRVLHIVRAGYFTNPIFVDIARIVTKAYERHPNNRFTKATLLAVLKDELGKRWREHRRLFRKTVREIFAISEGDQDFVAERAVEFARTQSFREGLVEAEKLINRGRSEAVTELFAELDQQFGARRSGQSTGTYDWKNLPHFDPSAAPKTRWLCEDLIPERAITFLVANAGTYKSTFALALCTAISTGEEFLGRATRKRRVLYLDNENPPDVLRERNEAMHLELETNKRLRLWSMYGGVPLPKLGSSELREIVKASVAQGRKPLLVFDHWASFLKPGEGGETTGQTSALLQEMKYLCGLGATIVVLAHTLKYDKTMWYGGADIMAKADAMHTFIREEDPVHPGRSIVRIECFLKRHGGKYSFAIQPIVKHDRVTGFRVVEDPRKRERQTKIEKLRELIKKSRKASQRELANLATDIGFGRDEAESLLRKGIGKYWRVRKGPKTKRTYVLLKHRVH
jgi:replicative DNA helicase